MLLCAAPLATVDELARFGRVPSFTLRERLDKLAERGLADTVSHHLGALGSRPQRRYFPTEKGVTAAGAATEGRNHMLKAYPVSKQWFRLLAERLDAVAALYRVAAMIADADPKQDDVRVDHRRHGPYDLLATLSGGLTVARRGYCRRPTPWTGHRWPDCTRLHKCNLPRRTFPVGGPSPPRMGNFAATCHNLVPLRPRHCNMLQSRHVRPSSQMTHPPPDRYAIQVQMPATAAKARTLTNQPSGPDSVPNRGKRSRSRGFRRCPKGKWLSFPCLRATGGKVAKCCRSVPGGRSCRGTPNAGFPLLECKTMCYNSRRKERSWPP